VKDPGTPPSLHLIVGTWGSGKSSVVPHLNKLLPECVVFDWDAIIPGISAAAGKNVHTDPSSWNGLWKTWGAVVTAVLAGGHDVVLCGPATPDEIARRSGLSGMNIRCAYLDCPDEVLVDRLRGRGESDADIAEELQMASALRKSDYLAVPVENFDPPQVAERLRQWIRTSH
jgi:predicted kinase